MEYKNLQKYFYNVINKEILKYANEYILLDWIDINNLNWKSLSLNPHAIHLLAAVCIHFFKKSNKNAGKKSR
jgi:hypothetical protein